LRVIPESSFFSRLCSPGIRCFFHGYCGFSSEYVGFAPDNAAFLRNMSGSLRKFPCGIREKKCARMWEKKNGFSGVTLEPSVHSKIASQVKKVSFARHRLPSTVRTPKICTPEIKPYLFPTEINPYNRDPPCSELE